MDLQREQKTRRLLSDQDLGGLLLFRSDELVLALGYLPYWNVSLALCPREEPPILYVPELEPPEHLPANVKLRSYPWGAMTCDDPYRVLIEQLTNDLQRLSLMDLPLGIAKNIGRSAPGILSAENPSWPPDLIARLDSATSGGLRDVASSLSQLYECKTSTEVEAVALANQIAGCGLREFSTQLIPGKAEAEVAAAVESTIHSQTGQDGVKYARGWAMVQSGINTAQSGRYNLSTGRRLQEGDLVLIELATCVNGYWSDLTRTCAVGDLTSEHRQMGNLLLSAQKAAVEAVRPGVACEDIDSVARTEIEEAGFGNHFLHATGHHVGFRYHDPGPLLMPGVKATLEPGMIVTVEPGIYGESLNGGVRIEDNVLVTERGHRILSEFHREL